MTGESLYVILGIEKGADQEQIKKAYRKRALRLHPDKNHDNPDKEKLEAEFKELNRVSITTTGLFFPVKLKLLFFKSYFYENGGLLV